MKDVLLGIKKSFSIALKLTPVALILTFFVIMNRAVTVTAFTYISSKVFDLADQIGTSFTHIKVFWLYVSLYLGIYLFRRVVEGVQSLCSDTLLAEKLKHALGIQLAIHASKMDLIHYEVPEKLNSLYRARGCVDKGQVHKMITRCINLLTCILGFSGIVSVLANYHMILIVLAIVSVLPILITRIIRGKNYYRLKKHQSKEERKRDYFYSVFIDTNCVKEMRVFNADSFFYQRWKKINDEVNREKWAFESKDARVMLYCNLFKALCYGTSISIIIYFVYRGEISVGQFGSCILAFSFLQDEIETLIRATTGIGDVIPFVNDFFTFLGLGTNELATDQKQHQAVGRIKKIVLDQVSFSYPGTNQSALEDICLTIREGEHIAVVGENGSGKTTLAKVILGIYEAERGNLLYNGINSKEIDKNELYTRISIVTQKFMKYYLSLRENVAMSDIDQLGEDQDIQNALARAGVSKNGIGGIDLEMQIGREFGGIEFSGGEWQKIAIARGLFRDFDFIVFDEPTSALDPVIESEILHSFLSEIEGKTALIVSHRVGICRKVDRIVVMREGKIVECGSQDELMKAGGFYYQLYTEQEKWYR